VSSTGQPDAGAAERRRDRRSRTSAEWIRTRRCAAVREEVFDVAEAQGEAAKSQTARLMMAGGNR
jgi:hypothetical protein